MWGKCSGAMPWPEAVAVCASVAGALNAAHRLGVVHREERVLHRSSRVFVLTCHPTGGTLPFSARICRDSRSS